MHAHLRAPQALLGSALGAAIGGGPEPVRCHAHLAAKLVLVVIVDVCLLTVQSGMAWQQGSVRVIAGAAASVGRIPAPNTSTCHAANAGAAALYATRLQPHLLLLQCRRLVLIG